jgi:DNA polymerase III subunit delta'
MFGNAKTIKLLERIIASRRIANAYIFLGPEGVGKLEMALYFAKKIVHNKEKIDSNLILVGPEIEEKNGIVKKRDIKIEAIRDLQHKLSLTSTGGEYKAVVISEAQRLNITSQNALLKTLEEPNDKVVMILVSQDEKKILPTIVSRCQKIKLGLVADSEIRKIKPEDAIDRESVVFWSAGRSRIAQQLMLDPQELDYMKEIRNNFAIVSKGSMNERLALAEKWSKDANDFPKKMGVWIILLRRVMLGEIAIGNISRPKALEMIEAIAGAIKNVKETNSNVRLVLENLFLKI